MESNKKLRATNFTAKEEHVLINLVKKYKYEIECKRTDTNTNKIKANAWLQLAKEYNSMFGDCYRDCKILKNKYENIKKRTKQKFADHKTYIKGTGGGPSKDIIVTTTDNDIHEIIGTQLTGNYSEFDDDCTAETIHITCEAENFELPGVSTMNSSLNDIANTAVQDDNCSEVSNYAEAGTSTNSQDESWSKYTPTKLRIPKTPALKLSENKETSGRYKHNKSVLGHKLEEWGAGKAHLVKIQQQCYVEEHTLKLKLMQENHEQQLRLQERESQRRIEHEERDAEERSRHLKIEHEKKLEILELEKKLLSKK